MSDHEKPHQKASPHDFFIKIVGVLNLRELPEYERFNLTLSAVIAVVALALALPPILALVNNIVISIGNIIIIVSGNPEHVQSINNSISVTIILPLVIVVLESIVCLILCHFYKKMNKPPVEDE